MCRPRTFCSDLQVIGASLRAHHGESLAAQRLHPLIRAVKVFGFCLSTVDLRQSSDKHEAVVAELLAVAQVDANYAQLDEVQQVRPAAAPVARARPLRVVAAQYSELTRSELAIFETGQEDACSRYGRRCHHPLHHQPHRNSQRPAGSAAAAKRSGPDAGHAWTSRMPGCDLIVVPLFETIGDLRAAADIMRPTTPSPV